MSRYFDLDDERIVYDRNSGEYAIYCVPLDMPPADVRENIHGAWIPCSERLPSEDDSFNVLCCDKWGEIMIGHVFACDDSETFYSAESEHEYMYDCVAWRPLPEPWKGAKDE